MSISKSIGLLIALVASLPACLEAQDKQGVVQKDSTGKAPLRPKVSLGEIPTAAVRADIKAAKAFARAVAGENDEKYVDILTRSLDVAFESHYSGPGDRLRAFESQKDSIGQQMGAMGSPARQILGATVPKAYSTEKSFIQNTIRLVNDAEDDPDLRTLNGRVTKLFPESVALGAVFEQDGELKLDPCCSGTIIAERLVLTSAHCRRFNCSQGVFIGQDASKPGKVIEVADKLLCPKMEDGTQVDLMILVLKNPARLIDNGNEVGVRPAQIIPEKRFDPGISSIKVVGYGSTDERGRDGYGVRQEVDVPLITCDCKEAEIVEKYGCRPEIDFVAADPISRRDSAKGDSGGGVYVLLDKRWYLVGVTWKGVKGSDGRAGKGGIYIRLDVPPIRGWIDDSIRRLP